MTAANPPARPAATPRSIGVLLGLLALSAAVATLGGLATGSSVNGWYERLQRPAITPPGWAFGAAWTPLYIIMAVSAWLFWRRTGAREGRTGLALYALQMGLNLGWSFAFFGFRSPLAGLAVITALVVVLAATTASFFRQHRVAGILLLPYLAWVLFATALNFEFWRINA